jgi:hypothetical protein
VSLVVFAPGATAAAPWLELLALLVERSSARWPAWSANATDNPLWLCTEGVGVLVGLLSPLPQAAAPAASNAMPISIPAFFNMSSLL